MKTGYDNHFKKMKKNTRFQVKPSSSPAANRPEQLKVQKRKKKQSFPFMSFMIATCILGGATYGYMNPEVVEQYVGNVEIGFLGESFASSEPAAKQKLPSDSKKWKVLPTAKVLKQNQKLQAQRD